MADRGLPVRFGFFPEPLASDAAALVDDVLHAERLGFDLVGIQDHPYNSDHLDTMTLLAVLAARTSRIGLFPTSPARRCGHRPSWPRARPPSTCSRVVASTSAWAPARSGRRSTRTAGRAALRVRPSPPSKRRSR